MYNKIDLKNLFSILDLVFSIFSFVLNRCTRIDQKVILLFLLTTSDLIGEVHKT